MGNAALLDRIHGTVEALLEKGVTELRARYPELPASESPDQKPPSGGHLGRFQSPNIWWFRATDGHFILST